MATRVRTVKIAVFVFSLAAYLALAGWMLRVWLPLGDEPHYLLAAYSLVHDHDLDLANNYAHRDFQEFFAGDTLDPHVKILLDGRQILNHDLGLPFVIALPFALGGRAGVEIFLAVCAALLAWQMWQLAYDVSHSALWATGSWLALAFTPPLVMYATLIYPEMLGALIFLWSTRTILFRPVAQISPARLAALAAGMALLPWLSIRFLIPLALLLLFVTWRWLERRSRLWILYAVVGVAIVAYFGINNVLLAGRLPPGNPAELAGGNLTSLSVGSLARGVLGWWIDPQRGILIMAPVYILALAGIPRLLRNQRGIGILLVSPLVVLVPLIAALGGFWIPFEVGGRYFVIALPLLAAPLALAFQAGFEKSKHAFGRRLGFGISAGLLLLLSLGNGALMISDAALAYGSVVTAYSRAVGTDISVFFAELGEGTLITPLNAPPSAENAGVSIRNRDGEAVWHAGAGTAGTIIQSYDLTDLTAGNYDLEFRAAAQGTGAEGESVALDVYSVEGLPIVHASWDNTQLASNGKLNPITLNFNNPYYDHWSFPLTLQVTTDGSAEVWLSALTFSPDTWITWLRAGLWVGVVLVIVVGLNLDLRMRPDSQEWLMPG